MSVTDTLNAAQEELEGTSVVFNTFLHKLAEFFGYVKYDDVLNKNVPDSSKLTMTDLGVLRFEDLEGMGVPMGKARVLAKIFRTTDDKPAAQVPTTVKLDITSDPDKHAQTLTPAQCVDHFDPTNATNPYGTRIKEAVNNRPCLAFAENGEFNVEATRILVQEILDGYPEREHITIDDIPGLPVYCVGDRPDRFADENPAKPGVPMRSGDAFYNCIGAHTDAGVTKLDHHSENRVPKVIQQLVYLAVLSPSRGGSGEASSENEMDLFDKVKTKSFNEVAARWPRAAGIFHNLKKTDTLPQLRLRLRGMSGGGDKPNDPFVTDKYEGPHRNTTPFSWS